MKQNEHNYLTENELISSIKKAGTENVSKRAIADLRRKGLLPQFEIKGKGRGKGAGKTESGWRNANLVIEQAQWIYRMLAVGIKHEDLYLYLWMLDYPISIAYVRDSLLEPLTGQIQLLELAKSELQEKCDRGDNLIEDLISEETSKASELVLNDLPQTLIMPQELLEAIANVILNPEYNLDEFGFAESFQALEAWEEKMLAGELKMFEEAALKNENSYDQVQLIFDLLNNADFIQRHFSLHQVEVTVRECSDKDLMEIQSDLRAVIKIFLIFSRAVKALAPHIRLSNLSEMDELLPILFKLAEWIVLANLSLRRNGYSELITHIRSEILAKIEKELSEAISKEIQQSAPVIGETITQSFELIERGFAQLAANLSESEFARLDCQSQA